RSLRRSWMTSSRCRQGGLPSTSAAAWARRRRCYAEWGFGPWGSIRNEARIGIAGQRFPLAHFVVGDIEHLPFSPARFDALYSKGVLQYVSWRETIRDYAALLKPGGRAIFIVNLAGNPFARAYRLVHRWRRWQYGAYLTPKEHLQWGRLEA